MFAAFVQSQQDYLTFLAGFAWLVLGLFCLFARASRRETMPWHWLGGFAALYGLYEWGHFVEFAVGEGRAHEWWKLLSELAAFGCLFRFVVGSPAGRAGRPSPRWLPTILLVPVALAAARHLPSALVLTRFLWSIPAGVLAVSAILRLQSHCTSPGAASRVRLLASLLAAALAFLVPEGVREAIALWWPATPNSAVGIATTALLECRGFAAMAAAIAFWAYLRAHVPARRDEAPASPWVTGRVWLTALCVFLAAGWMLTYAIAHHFDQRKRTALRHQVRLVAGMLNPLRIEHVAATPDEQARADLRRLREQVITVRAHSSEQVSVRLVRCVAGQLITIVTSDDAASESVPRAPDECLAELFAEPGAAPVIEAMHRDATGVWIRAACPILSPSTHQPIAALILDLDARQWEHELTFYRLVGIAITLTVGVILLTAFLVLQTVRETTRLLAASQAKFQTVFDSVNDAISIHDLTTGDVLEANRRAYEMVGASPADAGDRHPMPFSAHTAPYDSEHADVWIRRAAAGEPQLFEWQALDAQGRPFWVEVSLRQALVGDRQRLLAVVRNIDIRKRAQEELRRSYAELEARVEQRTADLGKATADLEADAQARAEVEAELRDSEARFRALAETESAGIMIFQGDHFVYANPGAELITGYSRADLERMAFWEGIHPDFQEEIRARARARQRGEPVASQYSVKIVTSSGAEKWILTTVGAIMYGGHPATLVMYFDVSQHRKHEDDKQRRQQRLLEDHKLESLGAMAAGIAHDFNNLLMVILGNTELLLREDIAQGDAKARLEDIRGAARRAGLIADHMLTYAGHGIFLGEPLKLSLFLHGIKPFLASFSSTQTDIVFDVPENLPPIEGDANQIRQILVQLVTNAAEAIGEQPGHITVRASTEQLVEAECGDAATGGLLLPGDYVVLAVSDTGPGIDDATAKRIFDPFFSTKFIGRGLGLSAVLGIVRNHRGAIRAASTPGTGTTIRVLFPVVPTAPPASAPVVKQCPPAKTTPPARGGAATILVIDDEDTVARLAEAVLAQAGYRVLTAADGWTGLQVLRDQHVDLVLLDLTMPGLNGDEVLREIRKQWLDLPVILSSGYAREAAITNITRTQIAGFLKKPYRTGALVQAVQDALPQRPLPAPVAAS